MSLAASAAAELAAYGRGELDRFSPRAIAQAFGVETPAKGFQLARDAIQNPVLSPAERERIRELLRLCVVALSRKHAGNVTGMANSLKLSRPTFYRILEETNLDKPVPSAA